MNYQQKYQQENNGISQGERLPRELSPDYLNLDNRSFEDLLKQMALFSENVGFYDGGHSSQNWAWFFTEFFEGLRVADMESDSGDASEVPSNVRMKKNDLEEMMKAGTVPPHMALIMAFLKLYQVQQKNFNAITERHLQFFYKDVLGFNSKKGSVGKTTLFLEIAKGFDSVLVPKGTLFDAGKDDSGKPITYVSMDDLELNKAKVRFFGANRLLEGTYQYVLHDASESSLLANTSSCQSDASPNSASVVPGSALPGNYGFAISSPLFIVEEEGVDLEIQFLGNSFFKLSGVAITYTGKSGWSTLSEVKNGGDVITIPKEDMICPYDKKIHGEGFDTQFPVIRFIARDLSTYNCTSSSNRSWPKLKIRLKGSRNLLIENTFGTFANQTGVMVFGPVYGKNDSFNIRAVNEYTSMTSPNGKLLGTSLNFKSKENGKVWYMTPDKAYNPQEDAVLLAQKVVDYYATTYANVSMSGANTGSGSNPSGIESVDFRRPATIVEPFSSDVTYDLGSYQIHLFSPYGLDVCAKSDKFFTNYMVTDNIFPDLAAIKREESVQICLENVTSPMVVSLYFQLDSDCSGSLTEESHQWLYMSSSNEWKTLGDGNVLKDSTCSLRRSGVIYLRIPNDALSSSGLVRIQMVFEKGIPNYEAIQNIRTQAVEVEYNPTSQGVVSAGQILAFNSIKKTVNVVRGVKKVFQPFDGELGEPDETADGFKCRVSERLRHKGRAWSSWDYERLVLERFPQIAAVKCLRGMDADGNLKAGSVLILVVPDPRYIKKSEGEFCCCPMVDSALQCEVKNYLEEVKSPFVSIEVCSPSYVVQTVQAGVRLKPGYSESSCKDFINEQLRKFIAPWSDNSSSASFSNKKKTVSDIVFFLENLECVDCVSMDSSPITEMPESFQPEEKKNLAIYTSADCHNINIFKS